MWSPQTSPNPDLFKCIPRTLYCEIELCHRQRSTDQSSVAGAQIAMYSLLMASCWLDYWLYTRVDAPLPHSPKEKHLVLSRLTAQSNLCASLRPSSHAWWLGTLIMLWKLVGWLVEWGFYALSASKAIFRARTYKQFPALNLSDLHVFKGIFREHPFWTIS